MAATMPPPSAAHQLQVSPASYVFNNNTTSCRQWSYRRGSTAGDGSDRRVRLVSGRAFADGIDVPRCPFFLARRAAWRARRSCRGDPTIRADRRAGGFADDKDAAWFSGRCKDGHATGTSPHRARVCAYVRACVCLACTRWVWRSVAVL